MVYAIVSDIHANMLAFATVLANISERRVDRKICLGDLVGYCAEPNECVGLARGLDVVLMGNHDRSVEDPNLLKRFNYHARTAMEWTIGALTPENRTYLAERPYEHAENGMTLVHATPQNPREWGYVIYLDDAMDAFRYFTSQICFIGHSHVPMVITDRGEVLKAHRFECLEGVRYIVNVGSVGQPRDQDMRACYVLYDSDAHVIEYVRLRYNVPVAQQTMQAAGFSQFLINRLSEGR